MSQVSEDGAPVNPGLPDLIDDEGVKGCLFKVEVIPPVVISAAGYLVEPQTIKVPVAGLEVLLDISVELMTDFNPADDISFGVMRLEKRRPDFEVITVTIFAFDADHSQHRDIVDIHIFGVHPGHSAESGILTDQR